VKKLRGAVTFKRGGPLKIQPLDFNGYPRGESMASSAGREFGLAPETIYYLLTRS
jgi:hypothetical protein